MLPCMMLLPPAGKGFIFSNEHSSTGIPSSEGGLARALPLWCARLRRLYPSLALLYSLDFPLEACLFRHCFTESRCGRFVRQRWLGHTKISRLHKVELSGSAQCIEIKVSNDAVSLTTLLCSRISNHHEHLH